MPQRGYVVDTAAMAREGARVDGEIDVRSLSRLAESLADDQGQLRFRASGGAGPEGELFLDLSVDGTLHLGCQRCLAILEFPVVLRSHFLLVRQGEEWPEEELTDDRYDAIAAEPRQDLVELIEQEVILALPLAPRHPECSLREGAVAAGDSSPFAALAALKRGAH